MDPYVQAKDVARSMDVEVREIHRTYLTRNIAGFSAPDSWVEVEFTDSTPVSVKAWALLHELGHQLQYRSGYLTVDVLDRAYADTHVGVATDETVAVERDAWRRAGRLAAKHGIEIDEEARSVGRLLLKTYKDCVR